MNSSNLFIPLCNDLYPTVFSFLLYTESISLQKCSLFSLKQKEKMEKYCQHIHPHGKIESYHIKTKTIQKEENYKEGKKEGIHKEWYFNGKIAYEGNWKEGKIDGIKKDWYQNGQLMTLFLYKEGKPNGIQKFWGENGNLWNKCIYQNGILQYHKNY